MSRKTTKIYKCPVCDTVVEVLEPCGLELVCCGPEMIQMTEKVCTPDDPHALIVEKWGDHVKVSVGGLPHRMELDHYIAWIEVIADDQSSRQFLKPGEEPSATFTMTANQLVARAYCINHGLWRSIDGGTKTRRGQLQATAPA